MTWKDNRLTVQKEREPFRNELKLYCKVHKISQRHIAKLMNIEESEFHNMLHGWQSSIPSKGITSWAQFTELVLSKLGVDSLEV